ncbi:MAG: hypothetical protein NTV72_02555 [Candidatus Taylorbacteria bacterium]|nr:hypothetical protein [Candidatus Taylorbacteria bacterium]
MIEFKSGVLDKTRMTANFLMLILLIGNIFFSIQYTESVRTNADKTAVDEQKSADQVNYVRFMKSFINIVLDSKAAITMEQRVRIENDVFQTHDGDLIKLWNLYVNSKDGKSAQENAVNLMVMGMNKVL